MYLVPSYGATAATATAAATAAPAPTKLRATTQETKRTGRHEQDITSQRLFFQSGRRRINRPLPRYSPPRVRVCFTSIHSHLRTVTRLRGYEVTRFASKTLQVYWSSQYKDGLMYFASSILQCRASTETISDILYQSLQCACSLLLANLIRKNVRMYE